jgi:glycosyltransferase involved in cell wall biosynthesis
MDSLINDATTSDTDLSPPRAGRDRSNAGMLLGLPESAPRPAGKQRTLRVAYLATQGADSGDEARIAALLAPLEPVRLTLERERKRRSSMELFRRLVRERPDVVVMEGSGLGGGAAVVAARALCGIPYVVSSGDAVGPYLGTISRLLAIPGTVYERILCKLAAGYIGWSPYLVGRALTFGARRAMTAAHWASHVPTDDERRRMRAAARGRLGIREDELVLGLVGSLAWSRRRSYCYGLELVKALRETSRSDLRVLIVGDGDGRRRLERLAGDDLGRRILIPGAVPRDEVLSMVSAMDVASLPQSIDEVGAVRYTTKLSEYLAAGVPVATGQLPLAYDLDDGWLWRIEGGAPWEPRYIAGMARLMEALDDDAVSARRERVPRRLAVFDFDRQQKAVTTFVVDCVEASRRGQIGLRKPVLTDGGTC